jgi:hypothetical protein
VTPEERHAVVVAATPALVGGIFSLLTKLLDYVPPPSCEHGKPGGRWCSACRPLGEEPR